MPKVTARHVNIGDVIRITCGSAPSWPYSPTKRMNPVVIEGVVEAASDLAGPNIIRFSIYRQPAVICKSRDEVELIERGHCVVEELEEQRAVVCNHSRWYPLYRMSQRWRWDICKASPISTEVKWCRTREEAIAFVNRYKR